MERRQNQRFEANYDAEVLYRSGRKMQLPVLDISLAGCMVDARAWSVKPDENVSIRLPGLNFQPAKVVWNEDGRAGVVFEELLYEPTLEHLTSLGRMAA